MLTATPRELINQPMHDWLRTQQVAYVPVKPTPVLETFASGLLAHFERLGHTVSERPDNDTDILLTTAPFLSSLNWRRSLLFSARRKFNLQEMPTLFTMIHARPGELEETLAYLEKILRKRPPDPQDYGFAGLAPTAYRTLYEQGCRGGPILALARVLQSQAKSIRIILVVGESQPEYAYLFDLVGSHPRVVAADTDFFYSDIVVRLATVMSTQEITAHKLDPHPVSASKWQQLRTPAAMRRAAIELGRRNFFTEMVRVANLVHVPTVDDSVARQYSEGCFATWDADIGALMVTITGSARPVEKDAICDDDLAVISGIRPDRSGVIVRPVEGKQNFPPSSEAVEMMDMDTLLPFIHLPAEWQVQSQVPVVRSKLHGHRGVASYDPACVEFVPLESAYYSYPVSCATAAQARGIVNAFSRAESLLNAPDPRKVVFTVLPGHGVMIAEKWTLGTAPFETIYEFMDKGQLKIDNFIPQGYLGYRPAKDGCMHLETAD